MDMRGTRTFHSTLESTPQSNQFTPLSQHNWCIYSLSQYNHSNYPLSPTITSLSH